MEARDEVNMYTPVRRSISYNNENGRELLGNPLENYYFCSKTLVNQLKFKISDTEYNRSCS